MGSKNQTSTSQQTTTPVDPAALQNIYNQVAGAAATPFTPYTGELTAPVNQQQQQGISGTNAAAGAAQPAISQATGMVSGAANPLTAQQIQNYQNPYTQSVINATQAQFNNQNAQQQQQVKGNAAMAGALGGDRQAVAQSTLAGQQQQAEAPVIAGLEQSGYNQAVSTAEQQYQQNPMAAAGQLANIGVAGQTAALQGAQSQIGAGTLEQQTQQSADTAAYQQYLQQQGYPFQTAAFLAQYGLGAALGQGSTTSGTQTAPGPNIFGQLGGLGIAGISAFSDKNLKEDIKKVGKTFDGQPIYSYRFKGSPMTQMGLLAQDVERSHPDAVGKSHGFMTVDYDKATSDAADRGRFAAGGPVSFLDAPGYVPLGGSAPSAQLQTPTLQYAKSDSGSSPYSGITAGLKASHNLGNLFSGPSYGGGNILSDDAWGGSSNDPLPGLSSDDYGAGFKDGGFIEAVNQIHRSIKRARGGIVVDVPFAGYGAGGNVRRYADGGTTFDDRFSAAFAAMMDDAPSVVPDSAGPTDPTAAPMRMPSPDDVQAWRAGVDHPNAAVSTDVGPPPTTPAMIAQGAGMPAPASASNPMTAAAAPSAVDLPPQITNPDGADTGSAMALGYTDRSPIAAAASAPSPSSDSAPADKMGGWNPFRLSDKMRESLLAAGLGMMASKSPFFLSAVGEGGLKGISQYNELTKEAQEAQDKAATRAQEKQRIDLEAKRLAESIETQRRTAASADLIPDGKGGLMPNPAKLAYLKAQSDITQKDNWSPIGSVVSGDSVHPLVQNHATGEIKDAVTGQPPREADKIQTKDQSGKNAPEIARNIANGIKSGRQPPTMIGLYGQSGAVRSALEEDGFDLAKAQLQYKQAEKQVATLNGPQMVRFVGLAHSVDSTIDEVRQLSKAMANSGIPKLNAAKLALYMQAEGNSANGQLAARYVGAVNTLKEEFANLANGGYAPTDAAWDLANRQINADYGDKQLGASLDEVQRLIRYRVSAMPGLSTMGPGTANRYTGQQGSPPSAASATAPAAPTGIPAGSQYSPSRRQFRAPDGTIYNADGSKA
jgi:Chaperone of endosialidase